MSEPITVLTMVGFEKPLFSYIFLHFRFIRINRADVEVQTKVLEGGAKLTFMKFIFVSPSLEIKAPVLNDKAVGYQVGRPCLLKRLSHEMDLTFDGWHVWLILGRPK